jgi:hypothetical protein
MSSLREIAEDSRYTTIKIKAKLTPFPVSLELPDTVKEGLPRSLTKEVEGVRVMRFYTPPIAGDTIEFKGFMFKILARHHGGLRVHGSAGKDTMPIVITEYIGAIEGDSHGE